MAESKEEGGKLDKILAHLADSSAKMDAMGKRMDAMETSYGDSAKKMDAYCAKMDAWDEEKKKDAARADAARKDAEKEEEEKKAESAKADAAKKDAEEDKVAKEEKADAARADAAKSDAAMAARIEELARLIPKEISEDDRLKFVGTQARWERIAQAFGDSNGAPRFLNGETHDQYRRRLAGKYKQYSKTWKDVDLSTFADKALEVAEAQIYADADNSAKFPTDLPPDVLRQITKVDQANRTHISFVGSEKAAWLPFCNPDRKGRINTRFARS